MINAKILRMLLLVFVAGSFCKSRDMRIRCEHGVLNEHVDGQVKAHDLAARANELRDISSTSPSPTISAHFCAVATLQLVGNSMKLNCHAFFSKSTLQRFCQSVVCCGLFDKLYQFRIS